MQAFAEVIARLRAPDGCPWDREQTHLSLRPFLLEESYEVLDALDARDPAKLREELGDLLLQIVLHAQIATETGDFTLADVIDAINDKIVRRHPHVFGDVRADTADEVRSNWAAIKAEEQTGRGETADPFAGIPSALPALARAQAVQGKAARAGSDAPQGTSESRNTTSGGFNTGDRAAAGSLPPADPEQQAEMIGKTLWQAVALAEAWNVDAETALREETARYLSTVLPSTD
jgi:tetrapyrrole methylase family protein/MazG family protein